MILLLRFTSSFLFRSFPFFRLHVHLWCNILTFDFALNDLLAKCPSFDFQRGKRLACYYFLFLHFCLMDRHGVGMGWFNVKLYPGIDLHNFIPFGVSISHKWPHGVIVRNPCNWLQRHLADWNALLFLPKILFWLFTVSL